MPLMYTLPRALPLLLATALVGCGASDKARGLGDSAAGSGGGASGDSGLDTGESTGDDGGSTPSTVDSGAGDCVETDLGLRGAFDVGGEPTVASISATVPAGMQLDAAEVRYSDGVFSYRVSLDPARVIDGSALRWIHPFPAGVSVSLSLSLAQGGDRRCASMTLDVPQIDGSVFPPLESDWSYEAYPRPLITTASLRVLSPDGEDLNYVVMVDYLGRYMWSHAIEAPRAFAGADGVYLLPLDDTVESTDPAALTFIAWDGTVEVIGPDVEEYHHDFFLLDDYSSMYALSRERMEGLQDRCGRKTVLGDIIQRVSTGGTDDLWRTTEDYPSQYYSCSKLTDKSVSYLNGVSYHDGILAASSSPYNGPAGVVLGVARGGALDFLYLSDRPGDSDVSLSYEPACTATAFSGPHGVVCEDTAEGELNCFVHNRRGQDECDSLEWIRVLTDGATTEASCLISTYPETLPANEDCGNSGHHGTYDWLDGRLDDPDGLFGVQFSPAGAFITGIRANRVDGPTLIQSFHIRDLNADIVHQDNLEAPCFDTAKTCVSSGRFHTVRMGLSDSWSLADGP